MLCCRIALLARAALVPCRRSSHLTLRNPGSRIPISGDFEVSMIESLGRRVLVVHVCMLVAVACIIALVGSPVSGGEFSATFNSRLKCEYSSWHEGKVVGGFWRYIKIELVRNLLRRVSRRTVWMKKTGPDMDRLRKGDSVLINMWTRPEKVDWTKMPASFVFGPYYMGRIDGSGRQVSGCPDGDRGSRIINWFYKTGRWDARVRQMESVKPDAAAFYAVLPNGRDYLLYDEGDHSLPVEYPSRLR